MSGRRDPSTVAAIVAGEPVTIRSGDTVVVRWARYGSRPDMPTHGESAPERDPRDTGRFVRGVDPNYTDETGRDRGPAVLLTDQANVKRHNVTAYRDDDGRPVGRWLPLYRADGTPTTQIAAVIPA